MVRLNNTEADDDALKEVPDKKFYLAMDFNEIDNFRFQVPGLNPMSAVVQRMHMYSTQINHISFRLPPVPPLSQVNQEVGILDPVVTRSERMCCKNS